MVADDRQVLAGTTIARHGVAALIRGRSGCGKSDLALRAICTPLLLPGETLATSFQLVSDDMTVITRHGHQLTASAPVALLDKLEVRGIGIIAMPGLAQAPLRLIVDLVDGQIERLPDDPGPQERLLGIAVDLVEIRAMEASAPVKVALALERAGRHQLG